MLSVDHLTQVTLVSNTGTFLLYGMTRLVCTIAFAGVKKRGIFSTVVALGLGSILNVLMLFGVIYFAIAGGGSIQCRLAGDWLCFPLGSPDGHRHPYPAS